MSGALPKILIAWEFGANFGHLSKVTELARTLKGKADIAFACPKPEAARDYAPELDWTIVKGPAGPATPPADQLGAALNYPDDIRWCGWGQTDALGALVDGWTKVLDDEGPDILVAQAAPTALLAAAGRSIKTVMFGSGYDTPPLAEPMPPFLHWQTDASTLVEVERREAEILAIVNDVQQQRHAPTFDNFAAILRADRYLLATWPEIDHYAPRDRFQSDVRYFGQLITTDRGVSVPWRQDAEKRIFAYLRAGKPILPAAVSALLKLPKTYDVICAVPNATPEIEDRLEGTHVRLIKAGVRLDEILPDCDVGISHASNGVAAAFLLHGVPQVGLPSQIEQAMVARTFTVAKTGWSLPKAASPKQLLDGIKTLLTDPIYRENAQAVAAKYSGWTVGDTSKALADEVMSLVE